MHNDKNSNCVLYSMEQSGKSPILKFVENSTPIGVTQKYKFFQNSGISASEGENSQFSEVETGARK